MSERSPLRLLVVDDHEVVREGLVAALEADARFSVAAVAGSGHEALQSIEKASPDVAIVDLRLPDLPGDELCRKVKEISPATVVIVLSSYLTEESVRSALKAGASAYVTKAAGLAELRAVLTDIIDREGVAGGVSTSQIMDRLERLVTQRNEEGPSAQQLRILRLVADGATYRQVARQIGISESTVRFHLQNLKLKFEASSVAELVAITAARGLLSPGIPEEAGDR